MSEPSWRADAGRPAGAPPAGRPVFLARSSYRQRRLRDALRLMPVLGAILFMVPLLWPTGEGTGARTSAALVYLFVAWAGLACLAAGLAALFRPDAGADWPTPFDTPGDEAG
ncbi:hypothetical protein GCM10011392_19580 [Wenxinia marina]|uniref:hypothetical protein n=1 Tax=Wenxinia marina TaxID=390641 RepID=UPI000375F074|nr:hypothetical protein [Wenxinia marina]GGL65030.1 hypothetical protein GCM10011392_19580 [Wenxinia marina]